MAVEIHGNRTGHSPVPCGSIGISVVISEVIIELHHLQLTTAEETAPGGGTECQLFRLALVVDCL